MFGNTVARRYRFNNLVVGSVGAVGGLNVDVTIPADAGLTTDFVGLALPVDADLTPALPPPTARVINSTTIRLRFANPSAGAIDPADTFDWDVILFAGTGQVVTV